MRKFVRYSYIIALVVTCAVICPFLLKDTFTSEGKTPPLSVGTTQDNENTLSHTSEPLYEPTEESTENIKKDDVEDENSAKQDIDSTQNPQPPLTDQIPAEEDSSKDTAKVWAPPEVNVENRTEAVYAGANGAYQFEHVTADYFDDALFIGDSRTDGISLYSGLTNATYFCSTGMNVFDVMSDEADVAGIGSTTLESLLTNHTYGKIYLMLGINELGNSLESIVTQYYDVAQKIHTLQPDAILFIEGNLHVGAERSTTDQYFNNSRINALNYEISKLADNQNVFYIDVNEYFDDENGDLPSDITFDQVHFYGKYYLEWATWLQSKGVIPKDS